MQEAYRCPVYQEYSCIEQSVFASECEQGRLHVSTDACHIEILRPDGSACNPGEVGEVVGTCLFRRYQPFVRYRLGDLAMWDDEPCPCGRVLPVLKEVSGRVEDVVIGEDGRQIAQFYGVFTGLRGVSVGQVVQRDLRNVTVRVVCPGGLGAEERGEILRRMHERLGRGIDIAIESVPDIPLTSAGKFRAVVSHLRGEAHCRA
jgi:phenylacetate-CoA ligase